MTSKDMVLDRAEELAMVLKHNPELLDNPEYLAMVLSIRIGQIAEDYYHQRCSEKVQVTDLVGVEAFKDIKVGLN